MSKITGLSARAAALLILCSMLAPLASCGGEAGASSTPETEKSTETAASEVSATTELTDSLPKMDFKGGECRVLSGSSTAYKGYLDVEAETGDVLNDTIWKRNRTVEERFSLDIKETLVPATEANDTGYKIILAGDDAYELIAFTDRLAYQYGAEGLLYDYETIPYLDMAQPWWCGNINASLSLGGKQFAAYNDANLSVYDYTYVLLFQSEARGRFQARSAIQRRARRQVDDGRLFRYDEGSGLRSQR